MRAVIAALAVVAVMGMGPGAVWAFECPARIDEARAAVQKAETALDKAKDFRFRMGRLPGEQGYRISGRLRDEIQSLAGSLAQIPGPPTAGEQLRMKEVTADLAKMSADWDAFLTSIATLVK